MPKSRRNCNTASSTRSSGSSRSSTSPSNSTSSSSSSCPSSKMDQRMSHSPSSSEQQVARSESPPSSLYFITTDSSPARIRSHVMLNYHRNKRVSSQREQQGESSGHASGGAENRLDSDVVLLERERDPEAEAVETRIAIALPAPQRIIGSIAMGHAPHEFPIEMTRRSYELVLHIHNEACARTWAPFRDVYFPLALQDEATFYQLLSTADRHLCHLRAESNSPGATAYQSRAIQSIMNRLKDPVAGISDGVISTVLFFQGQDHMWGDHDRFMVHKSSLDKMIRLRGGIEALDENPLLRNAIFWVDIASACTFGTKPLYPPPPERLHKWSDPPPPTSPPADDPSDPFPQICSRWYRAYPHHAVLIQLLTDIHHMTLVVKARSPAIWRDPWYLGLDLNPLTWRLLAPLPYPHPHPNTATTPASTDPMLQPGIIDEMELPIRLAATLFISHYREAFLPFHRSYALHVTRLQAALLNTTTSSPIPSASSHPHSALTDELWPLIPDIQLWVFVMGGLCAAADSAERTFFIEGICRLMRALGLTCWEEVNSAVAGFLWSGEVVGGDVGWGELGGGVMSLFAGAEGGE